MAEIIKLYHTGYDEIRDVDIHYGRANADFGQGFYTTDDEEFARRWVREHKDKETILNVYELDMEGLKVHRFERGEKWFDYIFNNRHHKPDSIEDVDVIIGPIANDTIYDTLGIITSGFLKREEAVAMLMIGPCYNQVVIKSEKAVSQLKWIDSTVLDHDEIVRCREVVAKEEAEYQRLFSEKMREIE